MPVPEFIAQLREKVGHAPLWLPGVTVVIFRSVDERPEVLLVRQVPSGRWTVIGGCIEPGEDPDTAAAREVREETGLSVELDRLVWIRALPEVTLHNGDVVQFLDTAFVGRVIGDDHPEAGDDESDAVAWVPIDSLPPLIDRHRRLIELVLEGEQTTFGSEERRIGY